MVIFKKEYEGEDLYDIEKDVINTLGEIYEKNLSGTDTDLIYDSDGLLNRSFKVTVEVLK